jgi:hypothetical protein
MGSVMIDDENAYQLKLREQDGYTVEEDENGRLMVSAPGVVFISLRQPQEPAYIEIELEQFDNLSEDCRHTLRASGVGQMYYRIDLEGRERWEAYERANWRLTEAIFDCPETRERFEEDPDGWEDYGEYVWFTADRHTEVRSSVRNATGAWPSVCASRTVYAVRWLGDMPEMSVNGFDVVIKETCRFSDLCRPLPPEQLYTLDAKKFQMQLLRHKYPDSFVSFDDGPRGTAEVKWVMPGLVEMGGLTLTFAKENFGKTALVMSELWRASQRRDCNVLYLAFENHNGLDARCEALEQHYDSAPSFIAEKASWDLGELDQWSHVAELVEDRQQHFALFHEAPLVVVFDTMGAAILESSRIMTGAERFYGGLRQMIRSTGVSAWVIGHGNSEGDLFGFKGAKHDADVVTKITRRSNGRDHVHTRIKGRHAPHGERLCVFGIEVVNGVPVAVSDVEGKDAPQTEVTDQYPELPDSYLPLIPLLEDAGAVDGLTGEGLRGVLNSHCQEEGSTKDAIRQQRHRVKKALLRAEVIKEVDGLFYLVD